MLKRKVEAGRYSGDIGGYSFEIRLSRIALIPSGGFHSRWVVNLSGPDKKEVQMVATRYRTLRDALTAINQHWLQMRTRQFANLGPPQEAVDHTLYSIRGQYSDESLASTGVLADWLIDHGHEAVLRQFLADGRAAEIVWYGGWYEVERRLR